MELNDKDALIVVDVQNDFCPGGALSVLGGEGVVRVINPLQLKFDRIYFTRDWHPQDHCSFSDEPTFQDGSWPVHCVQDSPGAEFQGDLHVPSDATIINKGTDPDKEAYSGFQDTDLAARLRDAGVERVFVTGLATDYCVKATALDAVKAGFQTVLVENGCRGVDDEGSKEAITAMRAAGVEVYIGADVGE
jgi:nicotinamidase/pyrazinamidase